MSHKKSTNSQVPKEQNRKDEEKKPNVIIYRCYARFGYRYKVLNLNGKPAASRSGFRLLWLDTICYCPWDDFFVGIMGFYLWIDAEKKSLRSREAWSQVMTDKIIFTNDHIPFKNPKEFKNINLFTVFRTCYSRLIFKSTSSLLEDNLIYVISNCLFLHGLGLNGSSNY